MKRLDTDGHKVSGQVLTAWASVALLIFSGGCNVLYTGWPVPIYQFDVLFQPVQVKGWEPTGLKLSDGRTVMPKGMVSLPPESAALRAATQRGVEVAQDGRIYGLMRFWHTCGNDPVVLDLRRVDIAQLLAFQQEGRSTLKPGWYADGPFREGQNGWPFYTKFLAAFDPRRAEYFEERSRDLAESKVIRLADFIQGGS